VRRLALLVCLALAWTAGSAAMTPDTVIVVVRHAEKAATPASDPGLTPAGERRALALADSLEATPLAAVYATPYRRTQLTAEPAARANGLTVTVRPADETAQSLARELRQRHAGRAVLVVGHSNTVPALVHALTGITVAPIGDAEYSRRFTITLSYNAPPHLSEERFDPPVDATPP
jgi:broad specificity phosphatase PhoE